MSGLFAALEIATGTVITDTHRRGSRAPAMAAAPGAHHRRSGARRPLRSRWVKPFVWVRATTAAVLRRALTSAARATGGALLGGWNDDERRALIAGLVALPDEVTVVAMRDLAWRMGELVADHQGLSKLGAEAVAAAQALDGRVLVSERDDGPGIRQCCESVGVGYQTVPR